MIAERPAQPVGFGAPAEKLVGLKLLFK